MKQYKNINELLDYIMSKGVIVTNKDDALEKLQKYSYYGVINSYKDIFKTSSNDYEKNVSFDEIYTLYEFDKNICAHNDRLFSFHSKFLITFKIIDKNYDNKDKSTNIYMVMKSMKLLLGSDIGKEFENLIIDEIENLKSKIKSVDHNIILYLMGFPTNKNI